jgi:hypothetical protein
VSSGFVAYMLFEVMKIIRDRKMKRVPLFFKVNISNVFKLIYNSRARKNIAYRCLIIKYLGEKLRTFYQFHKRDVREIKSDL